MKLEYNSAVEESSFILTDFNCEPAQELLKNQNYYKILLSKNDECFVNIDGYESILNKNQILFCTTLNVLKIANNSDLIAVVFNREFYCIRDHDHEVSCDGLSFFGSSLPPIISLDEKEAKSFETMFAIFLEEFEYKDHIQGEMLRIMLKRLLIKSSRLIKKKRNYIELPNNQIDLIRKFYVLVEQNFKEKHKVVDYADMLSKSPKTLSNLFKKANYPSPLKIINDRIILEAKRLLLFSEKNIDQVTHELGYKEGGHFSKFFKKHCSFSPKKFKEEYMKKSYLK